MNFTFVKKAAPWLGTVAEMAFPAAAPLISIASKALSSGLGTSVPATADGIATAISTAMANPDQLATLKKIDDDFAVQMKTLGIQSIDDYAKIAADDRASARSMETQTKSRIPGILAISVTIGFFGLLTLTAFHTMPTASEKVIDMMTGSLGTAWIMIIGYYFGASMGQDRQTELLSQAPPIPK